MHADTVVLTSSSPDYPSALRDGSEAAFPRLWTLGDTKLLRGDLLGLFCSTRCPGDVILQAYETARALRDAGVPVIGGFHTPMEKECLDLLLRGTQTVVWCPARGLPNPRRLTQPRREALATGRLVILSSFDKCCRRMTADLSAIRNELVLRLATQVFFLYGPTGSKTEALCARAIGEGKRVLTQTGTWCANLARLGATPVARAPLVAHDRC